MRNSFSFHASFPILRRSMNHLNARFDRTFSSSPVAVEAVAGGSRPGWECSTGVAATRTQRERLPARIVAAASASESAASAASVTCNPTITNHNIIRWGRQHFVTNLLCRVGIRGLRGHLRGVELHLRQLHLQLRGMRMLRLLLLQ